MTIPDVGKVRALNLIIENGLYAHPYSNDHSPTDDTVLGDLTEAQWGNQAATLSFGSPSASGGVGTASATFTFTSWSVVPQTIYGYWVGSNEPNPAGPLLVVKRFDVPVVVTNANDEITRTVTLTVPAS